MVTLNTPVGGSFGTVISNRRRWTIVGRLAAAAETTFHGTHEFRHDAPRADSFRERMPVPSVRGRNIVIRAQVGADSDRRSFLADVQVEKTRHLPRTENLPHPVLKLTNFHHATIK